MYRFWTTITEPLLALVRPARIVEIGASEGRNTRHLLAYCRATGATLHTIDPAPRFDAAAWQEEHRGRFVVHEGLSLNVLQTLDPFDVALVDGDHNWYTVFHELTLIDRQCQERAHPFPIVLLHDTGWPYARRDLYYDPDVIPDVFRHPYDTKGLTPGSTALQEQGGLNAHLRHSIYEHNAKNGVMTAIEDFLRATAGQIDLVQVPGFHGMGILVPRSRRAQQPELDRFLQALELSPTLVEHLQQLERARVELEVSRLELGRRMSDAEQTAMAAEQNVTALKAALGTRGARITELQARAGDAEQLLARTRDELQVLATKLDGLRSAREAERRVHRAEADRLRSELEALTVVLRTREGELAAVRTQAAGIEQRLSEKTRRLTERERDLARIVGWIEALDRGITDLLGSQRWRVGNRLGELVRRVRFQPQTKTAADSLRGILRRFHSWDVSRTQPSSRPSPGGTKTSNPGGSGARSKAAAEGRTQRARPGALAAFEARQPVTVIVPVHDGYDALTRCLASIERNTPQDARVLIIDDASPDPRISAVLERYASHPAFVVRRNESNLGFVRTVNRGLQESTGDVIILNSDTEVPPNWVRNLQVAAYLNPKVATVTPLSSNAGVFSAPVAHRENGWPSSLSFDEVGRLVTRTDDPIYPSTPTGHGFCLYIRRAAIDAVGLLDADAFPRGYGEETDFCLRASAAGFAHVVDDRTYVFHARGTSFGPDREALIRSSRAVLDRRYPEYSRLVAELKASTELARAREKTGLAFTQDRRRSRPRLLYLLHSGAGGTPQTSLDLIEALKDGYETYLLTADGVRLRLFEVTGRDRRTLASRELDRPWRITDFARRDYRTIFAELLWRYDIDLVHIRHLMGHSLDAPALCRRAGVPVVVSFHDFYLVCPTIHLLDENDRFCGGACTPGYGSCRIPTGRLGAVPPLKHAWVHEWQKAILAALRHADALVTTADHTREVYRSVYPDLDVPFHVIEHGRDFSQRTDIAVPPQPGRPIRILAPGNIGVNKGARLFRELKALDVAGRIDLHFLGDRADLLDGVGTNHGTYEREEFAERAATIAPSFVAILSIWPETYCHTLTEAWSCGVPVLASDIGVLRERITAHGGGWLLDYTNPERLYQQILGIADDRVGYEREAARATLAGIRSVADMARDYEQLYERLLARRFLGGSRDAQAPDGGKLMAIT